MKLHYKIVALSAFALAMASCQEDEVLDLKQFPENLPHISIDGEEGESTSIINATYQSDGSLSLDAPVTRNYTFNFAASPQDAHIKFDIINSNIPADKVSLSAQEAVIPAGFASTGVTVTLQDEDFSFATDNYEEATYELGVKATVTGFNIADAPIESKVIIQKEAYKAGCYITAEPEQEAIFKRTYAKQTILEEDPIAYQFRMKLDKPARQEVKVKFTTDGIKEAYQNNITITPSEVIIPAGETTSDVATWTITNDFLLESADSETFNISINATAQSEDKVVYMDEERSALELKVVKSFRNIGFIDAISEDWKEITKTDWGLENLSSAYGVESIIDGSGGLDGSGATSYSGEFHFIIDLKSVKTLTGFAIDYKKSWGEICGARQVMVSISDDNENWKELGVAYNSNNVNSHYLEFYEPVEAQYVRFKIFDSFDWMISMSEIYIYENK